MKFKVGDKIRGISDNYTIANKAMSLAEVVKLVKRPDIKHERMEIKIIEHTEKMKIGLFLQVHNLDTEFELAEENEMNKIEELEKQIELYAKNIESQQQSLETLKLELEQLKKEKENEVWKPKYGDLCWYVDNDGYIYEFLWNDCLENKRRYAIGNVFRTKEEAEFRVEQLKVEAELKRFALPFKIGCKNYTLGYRRLYDKIEITFSEAIQCGILYFHSKEIVQKAINTIGEDRIKKYYFGIE